MRELDPPHLEQRDLGEVYYPAFVLRSLHPATTKQDIIHYLQKRLGRDYPSSHGIGKSIISIVPNSAQANSLCVKVEGIKLPWKCLQKKLLRGIVRDKRVLYMQPDHGLELNGNSTFKGGSLAVKLQEHLNQTRGDYAPINIFRKDFVDKFLGGQPVLQDTIHLDDLKRKVNKNAIFQCLAFNDRFGPKEFEKRDQEGKVNAMWVKYSSPFVALVELCRLNQNETLSKEKKKFGWITKKVLPSGKEVEAFVPCEVSANQVEDLLKIPVSFLMEQYGYIPLGHLPREIFNLKLIAYLESLSECPYCGAKYKIVGVAVTYGWFAGTHVCTVQEISLNWPGEPFTRLTVGPNVLGSLMSFNTPKDAFRVYPVIEGVSPTYTNVQEFKRTALLAEKLEALYDRRDMMVNHHRRGRIVTMELIEERKIKRKMVRVFLGEIDVEKSKFWSEASKGTIGKVGLKRVPLDDIPHRRYSLHELNIENISAKMYELEEHDDICRVICHVYLPKDINLNEGDHVIVVPKPIRAVMKSMERIAKDWEKSYNQRRQGPLRPMIAEVTSVLDLNETKFSRKVFDVTLVCNRPLMAAECAGLLDKCYVGVEATFKTEIDGQEKLTRSCGRVYRIADGSDGNEMTLVDAVFLLYDGITILEDSCLLEWFCFVDLEKRRPALTLLPDGAADEDDESEDEDEIEDYALEIEMEEEEEESSDHDDEEDHAVTSTREPDFKVPDWIYVTVREINNPNDYLDLDTSSIAATLRTWKSAPPRKRFDMLDFFLDEETNVISRRTTPLVQCPRDTLEYSMETEQLNAELNPSQREAVTHLLESTLSVTQGPPGTGKTTTAVAGVFQQMFREACPIVAVAFSNFACDVLHKKMIQLRSKLNVPFNIIRMVTPSKEEKLSDEIEFDGTLLHHLVRTDPQFEAEEIQPILNVIRERGIQYLPKNEKDKYDGHVRTIRRKYLNFADIIICTVAVAGDGRLGGFCKSLHRMGKGISLILIDEASLLSSPRVILPAVLNPARVALFGDCLQLSPVAKCISSCYAGLDISWMDLLDLRPFLKENGLRTMLNIQYRMHPQIGRLVSKITYKGQVKTDESLIRRPTIGLEGMAFVSNGFDDFIRVAFVTYPDGEKNYRPQGVLSRANDEEIRIIAKMIADAHDGGVALERIAVITMYNAQTSVMRAYFGKPDVQLREVEVSTVDGFQGREKDVVFVSCVRCNYEGEVGHLKNQLRLNVALSRAMEYLIIVGNEKTLLDSCIPFWRDVLSYVKEHGIIITLE